MIDAGDKGLAEAVGVDLTADAKPPADMLKHSASVLPGDGPLYLASALSGCCRGDMAVPLLRWALEPERTGEEREDLVVGLAVLCHDLGKPATTRREEEPVAQAAQAQ